MGLHWGAGTAALPMRGTTQDQQQGLLAQHLVPWGQFSSLPQEIVQESSEEELSSGHTPALHTGWAGGWGVAGSRLPWGEKQVGQGQNHGEAGPQQPSALLCF